MKRLFLGLISFIFLGSLFFPSVTNAAPPTNFQTSQVIGSGLNGPSAFEIAPDGRIFILERTGKIKIFKNGQLLQTPFAELPSAATGDRGLIGIAFDPDFSTNHYVYFYYTGLDLLNRLVRFDASGDVGSNGPFILYQTSSPSELLHVGGSIRFGPDGKIYFAVGDNGYPPNAQILTNPHGKILRINKDGSIPVDNPFFGNPNALPEIWAYGFRNPWRFQFDPSTGRLYGADVGDFSFEEINLIQKGGNYGWPNAEGYCFGCSYINPIHAYSHDDMSSSVTGGPVYRGTQFPEEYRGSLFFGDYARGFIKRLTLNSSGLSTGVTDFDTNAGSVVDMKVGPDSSLYYITYYPGRLYKITYSTGNHLPIANATADVTKGIDPLTVNFSSTGSNDPDNQPITYSWNFGDGTFSTAPNPTKTYSTKGTFTVQLTVSDGTNSSQAIPIIIQVGQPPVLTIGTPKENATYIAGDTINYTASAVDSVGFDIDDARIRTEVQFHHDTHIHPFFGPVPGRTGSFKIPTTGEPDPDTWYEIIVSATDTNGLTTSKSISIYPLKSTYTLSTQPAGLTVSLDGIPQTTPKSIEGVVGFEREISAPAVQELNGKTYLFDHWSDNLPQTHIISTKSTEATYTAIYNEARTFLGQYYDNKNLSGQPVMTRQDQSINFTWNDASPAAGIPSDNFSVRWTKKELFSSGRYKFTTTTDDGVRLYIDGTLVIDKWIDQGTIPYEAVVDLVSGEHTIVMEYYEHGGGAIARLNWDKIQELPTATPTSSPTSTDYNAEYFDNMTLFGLPKLTRQDQSINFTWDSDSPDPSLPKDKFSARWTKTVLLEEGLYEFTATADDGIRIFIDDQKILDKWIDQPSTTYKVEKSLTPGNHTIKVEYYENGGGAVAKFNYVKKSTPSPAPTNTFKGEYWNTPGERSKPEYPSGTPALTRNDDTINFTWNDESPAPTVDLDHFVVRWTKKQTFEEGIYRFTTLSDDGVRVFLDDELLIDDWNDHATKTNTKEIQVPQGEHTIKVEYYENSGGAVMKFNLEKITTVDQFFNAEYFSNQTLSGVPTLTRKDEAINFVWNNTSPDPKIPNDHFSARWTKQQNFAAGTYNFTLKSDDGIRFWIDDKVLVDDWTDHAMKIYNPTITLTEGTHTLKIEYYENDGGAVAILE